MLSYKKVLKVRMDGRSILYVYNRMSFVMIELE